MWKFKMGTLLIVTPIIVMGLWGYGKKSAPSVRTTSSSGQQQKATQAKEKPVAPEKNPSGDAPDNRAPVKAEQTQTKKSPGVKLSNTSYWKYAYLISGNTLDRNARDALSGFKLEKSKLKNKDLKITLKSLSYNYRDQVYLLTPGEKLYFIETSFGDDSRFREYNLGDDAGVIVDANGYIVRK